MFDSPGAISVLAAVLLSGVATIWRPQNGRKVHPAAVFSIGTGVLHPVVVLYLCRALWLTTISVGHFGEACMIELPITLLGLAAGLFAWRDIAKRPEIFRGLAIAVVGTLLSAIWALCAVGSVIGYFLLKALR